MAMFGYVSSYFSRRTHLDRIFAVLQRLQQPCAPPCCPFLLSLPAPAPLNECYWVFPHLITRWQPRCLSKKLFNDFQPDPFFRSLIRTMLWIPFIFDR